MLEKMLLRSLFKFLSASGLAGMTMSVIIRVDCCPLDTALVLRWDSGFSLMGLPGSSVLLKSLIASGSV